MGGRRFFKAMRAAGWRYDKASGGFVKEGATEELWVSRGQAEAALGAAEGGESVAPRAAESRTVAKVLRGVSERV